MRHLKTRDAYRVATLINQDLLLVRMDRHEVYFNTVAGWGLPDHYWSVTLPPYRSLPRIGAYLILATLPSVPTGGPGSRAEPLTRHSGHTGHMVEAGVDTGRIGDRVGFDVHVLQVQIVKMARSHRFVLFHRS